MDALKTLNEWWLLALPTRDVEIKTIFAFGMYQWCVRLRSPTETVEAYEDCPKIAEQHLMFGVNAGFPCPLEKVIALALQKADEHGL